MQYGLNHCWNWYLPQFHKRFLSSTWNMWCTGRKHDLKPAVFINPVSKINSCSYSMTGVRQGWAIYTVSWVLYIAKPCMHVTLVCEIQNFCIDKWPFNAWPSVVGWIFAGDYPELPSAWINLVLTSKHKSSSSSAYFPQADLLCKCCAWSLGSCARKTHNINRYNLDWVYFLKRRHDR